ncbi:hypothetical protein EJ02DRAFT_508466 [Clathrospora elynae]|uniref:Uncharacterized protein n=1 Tax=Clathrospora elynae TaxID=706981 RepID=A0A6A5T725_9PLEO|nr:hypothetical protein EJ02DRAFT_508466 [Clathrospora elynae]
MPSLQTQLFEHQLFDALKSQITGLATALYGSTAPVRATASNYDVLSFTTPDHDAGDEDPILSIVLIYYSGPESSPFTAWKMLSYVDDQTSAIAGAEQLLADMRKAMGGVVGTLINTGGWKVQHKSIPNVAVIANRNGNGTKVEDGQDSHEGEYSSEKEENDVDAVVVEGGEESPKHDGQGGWKMTLGSIAEEL